MERRFIKGNVKGILLPSRSSTGGATIPWRNPQVGQPAKMRDPILLIKIEAHSRVSL